MDEQNLDYKEACEEALDSMESEFLRGAEALYHHLQDTIIGKTEDDAISIEVLKFLKPLRKKITFSNQEQGVEDCSCKSEYGYTCDECKKDMKTESYLNNKSNKGRYKNGRNV